MKELKKMTFGTKLKTSELKQIVGGGTPSGPGVGCRCQCEGGGLVWIQYYLDCPASPDSITINTGICGSYGSNHQLLYSATCTRAR